VDLTAELRSFMLGDVAQKGIEAGRDGAVSETLGPFELKDLAKAVFSRRGGQGQPRVLGCLAHMFDSQA
jgi:hypothetical protein